MWHAEIVVERPYGEPNTIVIEDDRHDLVYARIVGTVRGLIGYGTVVSISEVTEKGE